MIIKVNQENVLLLENLQNKKSFSLKHIKYTKWSGL